MEGAAQAFVEEDWDRAVQLYTEALAALREDDKDGRAVALASRAAAYLKLKQDADAFEDASRACELKPDYEVAAYRKGLAAFALGRCAEAKASLEAGLALRGGQDADTRKYGAWLRKCELELEDAPPVTAAAAAAATPTAVSVTPAAATVGAAKAAVTLGPVAKYQWYQSATHATVTLLQKGLKEEDADVRIEPRRLTVALKGPEPATVLFDKPLFDAVEPQESQAKFFSTKVEIKLKKATPYQWADLCTSSMPAAPIATAADPLPTPAAPAASANNGGGKAPPPRPYASHRDWEAVEREITKELEGEKPEGEEALNKLFQDIYKNASDDTRRAMVKSFQTSGGTVLSTNWEEVARKDYEQEKTAPEGMEWRKWG